ncbi:molecular chaperone DnaJ [Aeromonas hydrophila]|nr:molecular chaperone DnaJ [Aeromonas sp. ASNIH4]POU41354.1 molecular chaperone DnaJ [Aeromonas hydrophila]POV90691.1 molecular chaperone DnaJ [Aeromonas sp. ASNIH6]
MSGFCRAWFAKSPATRPAQGQFHDASEAGSVMNNYFRVLGVKSNASENDIKKAYRRLSNQYHPDKLHGASEEEKEQAALKLHQVKQAYEVLSDPKQRAAFIKDFNNVIVTDPAAAMQEMWDQFYP